MRAGPELGWSTPAAWSARALEQPLALLSDHAHCELGAAAAAQALVARNPWRALLVERLSALAIEELRHFRRVHRLLRELGGELSAARRNPYLEGLRGKRPPLATPEVSGDGPPTSLLDRLLVGALVEARSLERFELLGAAPGPPAITGLYRELAPSEAGHGALFLELARDVFPVALVETRLAAWIECEASVARALPFAPRIHSGPPDLQPPRDPAERNRQRTAAVAVEET